MDKKLLVSLMMTAPVAAFAAQFEYTAGGDGRSDYLKYVIGSNLDSWSGIDGILSTDAAKDGNLVVPIGFKNGVQHNGIMPVGTYTFEFSGFGGDNNSILVVNGTPQVELNPYQGADGKDVVDANGNKVLVPGYWENVKDKDGNDIVTENGGHVVKWVKVGNTEYSKMIPLASGTFSFKSTAGSKTLTLKVVPKNSSQPYTVGDVEGTLLNFSFSACYNTLQERLANAKGAHDRLPASVTNVPANQQEALAQRLKNLNTTYSTIQGNVEKINPAQGGADLGQKLEAAYNEFSLNNYASSKDGISTAITQFVKDVNSFLNDLNKQQQVNKDQQSNADNYKALQTIIISLRNGINEAELNLANYELPAAPSSKENPNYAEEKALYDYQKYLSENSVNNFKNEVNAFEKKVDETYANYQTAQTLIDKDGALFQEATAIDNQIGSISDPGNPYLRAANDWKAFGYFTNATLAKPADISDADLEYTLAKAKEQRDKQFLNIQNLITAHPLYLDLFDSTVGELDDVYNNNEGYAINQNGGWVSNNPNIIGAYSNYSLAAQQMKDRITAMGKVYTDFLDLQTNEDAKWEDAKKELAAAKTDGTTNNGNYRLDAIFSIQSSDAYKSLPKTARETIDKYINALRDAYNAWSAEAQDLYNAHNLWNLSGNTWNSDYTAAKQDFVGAYNNYVTNVENSATYKGTIEIITTFEVAVAHVNTLASADNQFGAALKAKFNENIKDIEAVVNEYVEAANDGKDETVADPNAPANVKTACENLTNSADNLFGAFNDAETAIKAAQTAVDAFNKEFKAAEGQVLSYTADGKPVYTFTNAWNFNNANGETVKNEKALTATNVQSAINTYNKTLQDIADGKGSYSSVSAAYTAALDVNKDVNDDNYAGIVNQGRMNFASVIAEKNKKALAALENKIKTIKTDTELQPSTDKKKWAPGLEDALKVKTGSLPSGCPASSTGIVIPIVPTIDIANGEDGAKIADAYVNGTKTSTGVTTLDSQMISISNAIKAQFEALVGVQTNFDNNKTLLNNLVTVEDRLTNVSFQSAIEYNAIKDYFDGEKKKLQSQIKAERTTIENAYNKMGFKDAAGMKTYSDQITAINNAITDLVDSFTANEAAYSTLVTEISSVSNRATSLYAYIDANNKVPEDRDKWLGQISDINDGLKALSDELKAAYAGGKVPAEQDELSAKVKAFDDELTKIQGDEYADYLEAVKASNQAYLDKLGISADQLNDQYNAAVNQVNEYRYDIENATYYAALMANESFVNAHSALQACHTDVIDLINERSAFLGTLTEGTEHADWVALASLTDAEVAKLPGFDKLKKDNTAIKNLISNTLNKVNNDACTAAQKYFTTNYTNGGLKSFREIATYLGMNYTGLDAEQVDELLNRDELGNLTSYMEKINLQYYGDADEEIEGLDVLASKNKPAFIMGMDAIANNIDKLQPQNGETREQYVKDKAYTAYSLLWSEDYDDITSTLNSGLNASGLSSDNKKQIENALKAAATVNSNWNKLNDADARQANYKTLKKDLDNATSAALATVRNNANDAAYAQLTGAAGEVAQTKDVLNELLAWTGYHKAQVSAYERLQGDIDNLVTAARMDPELAENLEEYNEKFADLRESISDIQNYYDMFEQECRYANNNLLVIAKNAFNNARVHLAEQAEAAQANDLDYYNVELGNIADAITELMGTRPADFTEANKDEYKADILTLEARLCQLTAELEEIAETATENTDLYKAQVKVDDLYDAATSQLTALSDKIAAGVESAPDYADFAEKYEKDVKTLKDELNNVKTAETEAGNMLLMDADKLEYELKQYQGKVDTLESDWQAKQDKADKYQISDNVYAAAMEKVNALWANVEYAKNLADGVTYVTSEWIAGDDVKPGEWTNVTHPVSDKTSTLYTDVYNDIKGKNGIIATLDKAKANHSLTNSYKLDSKYSTATDKYVLPTLTNVAYQYRTDDINTIVGIISDIRTSDVNEMGWKYSYINEAEYVDQLYNEYKKFVYDPYTESYIQKNIQTVPKADKPNETVEATASQAISNYERVKGELDAVMDEVANIKSNLEENKYLNGDVDNNGDVNVIDVQKLLNLIGEGVQYEDGSKDSATQDVNGDNQINIADVTSLINAIINNNGNSGARMFRAYMPKVSGINSYRMEEIQGENGLRRFAFVLSNEVTFSAGQIDIKLPSYARVANVQLGDRANELETYVFENDGYTRVLLTSLDNAFIEGSNGTVLYIDVEGNADIEVENVIFADAAGNSHNIAANGSMNGVGIMDAVKDGVKAIYNAAGQQLNKLTKGVNIIRNADGTVTKKIGK